MTAHRILQMNATATAVCALGLLAGRTVLFPLFGLTSPALLDVTAVALIAYAGALAIVAARRPVGRGALLLFTAADGAWVVGSALVLLLFWADLAPIARVLIVAVAVAVDAFAMLQFRAARPGKALTPSACR